MEESQALPIKREQSSREEPLPLVVTSRFELENEIERQFGVIKQNDSDDVEMRNETADARRGASRDNAEPAHIAGVKQEVGSSRYEELKRKFN